MMRIKNIRRFRTWAHPPTPRVTLYILRRRVLTLDELVPC